MRVVINGVEETGDFGSLEDLLQSRDMDPLTVVVEYNGQILRHEDLDRPLLDGDRIEIVQFVGGG